MSEQRGVLSIAEPAAAPKAFLQKLLDGIERVGNKVPHPAVIFFILSGLVIVLSHLFHLLGTSVDYEVVNPQTHQVEHATATVNSLLSGGGIRFMLTSMVRNFMNFGPAGIILVVMIGVGLAEQAGLINALIKKIVIVTPRKAVTWILVTLGVLASIAADAGCLVLIPLGAAAFLSLGRHPLAGLAAAFSGVAAVFGVNFLIVPIDPILTEITNDAIHLLNPTHSIDLMANFYFGIVSSLVLIVVCTVLTERVVEPRLGAYHGETPADSGGDARADLRTALHEVEGRPRGRDGSLPGGRLAAQGCQAAGALFRADRRLRAAIQQRCRCRHGCGDNAALRGGSLDRLDCSSSCLGVAGAPFWTRVIAHLKRKGLGLGWVRSGCSTPLERRARTAAAVDARLG
jgi:AbgT putative transporter family